MIRGLPGLIPLAVAALTVTAAGAASAPRAEPLPSSFCSKVASGGVAAPDYLIVSDLGLQNGAVPARMVAAIKFVLAQHRFKAGAYTIGYQSCDDSTPQSPQGDLAKCASNAKAYAADSSVVGVIGAWSSRCSEVELPIVGRSASGPLVLVSPTNTNPGLTHASGGSAPGEPRRYYPTGRRNLARLASADDFQGLAAAVFAKQLRLKRVFVLDDAESYGLDVAGGYTRAARNLGLTPAGAASWDVSQTSFKALAARVARARPDGVLLGGYACPACGALIKALHADVPSAKLIVPDGFLPVDALVKVAGTAAEGLYLIEPGLPPSEFGPVGQALQRKFGRSQAEAGGAPVAAQAVEVLLAAIARSDGSRSSVTSHVLGDPVRGAILGNFAFDRNGDMVPGPVAVYRLQHGRQALDRVLRVSSRLLR